MKIQLTSDFPNHNPRHFLPELLVVCLLAILALFGRNVHATTITFTNMGGSPNNGWTIAKNWSPNQIPGASDIALIDTTTNNVIVLNANTNAIPGIQPVGALVTGPNKLINWLIEPSSLNGTTNPVLVFYGMNGMLMSNASQTIMEIAAVQPAVSSVLTMSLATTGYIYANSNGTFPPNTAGQIELYANITETNGSHGMILNGPGQVFIRGTNNTYTGNTVISNGVAVLDAVGTFGNGGTVFLSGGNLNCYASRTGTSSTQTGISNAIVLTTNAYIYNSAGTTGTTRYFPLAGPISGTNATLIIANPTTVSGNTFDVRLFNGSTFNLPIIVGDNFDAFSDFPGSSSVLEFVNYPSNGIQNFTTNISGIGSILRDSAGTALGGTTIFTASNTYSGGTVISSGSLFANNTNTGGSAFGSGNVTVTNKGTVAGIGYIVAPTTVSLNGTIQPGATSNNVGNLSVSSLTFGQGGNYLWEITATNGTPGITWDLITCTNGWTDAGSSSGSPITVVVTSPGALPNWNNTKANSWLIITNNGSPTGFNAADWAVNSTAFATSNSLAGVFGVTTNGNGDLYLTYTPTSGNYLINVVSGSVGQESVTPTNYPVLTGLNTVTKIGNGEVIMDNSANSYQGATYIYAGTASASVNSTTAGGAFGASTAPLVLGYTSGSSNATLNIDQPGVTVANSISVQSGSTGVLTIGSSVAGGSVSYLGNVGLAQGVTLSAPTGGISAFPGNITGTGGVTFSGGGTFTMSGANTYTGPTTLIGSTLDLNSSGAIGSNTFIITNFSILDNTSGNTVTLGNNPPEIWDANIAFVGTSSLSLGTGAVTMNSNVTLTLSNSVLTLGGTIAGSGTGLTVVGPGELSLAAVTNSTFTGGFTNIGALVAINATATFGNGTGPVVFSGGNLLNLSSRSGSPISNPLTITTNTRVYGNSTDTSAPTRILPFSGPITVAGGAALYIDDVGSATTIFNLRLFATNGNSSFSTINFPVVIGDPSFDATSTTSQLDLQNDRTTPVQTVSGFLSGTGQVLRSGPTVNSGGTTIFTAQNTFSGLCVLSSGAIGFGASSTTSGGVVVSGPVGTGELELGLSTAETNLTLFATVGPTVEIDNKLYLNGDTNYTFAGVNNLLFAGPIDSGNATKTLYVTNGITVTFSGALTNSGTSGGGSLIKAGGGTMVLSGASTYIGSTTVNAGLLLVNGSIYTNTATANSGTLGGKGTIGGSVSFASGAQAYLFKSAGSSDTPLTLASNLTVSGNTVIVDLGGTTTLSNGTYTLINYSGTLSGTFATTPVFTNGTLLSGKTATIDTSTPNQVNLIVVNGAVTGPTISSIVDSGTSVTLSGTSTLTGTYRVVSSTNILLPLSSWVPVATNTFTGGAFSTTISVSPTEHMRFYSIKVP